MNPILFLLTMLSGPVWAANEPDQVTMELEDFLRLYDQVKEKKEDPEPAPRHFSLSSARYQGEVLMVDGEPRSARINARVTVQVHKEKGWVKVPLLSKDVALISARMGGREAPIVLEGSRYILVTDRKGSLDIDLEFAVKVGTDRGTSSFGFQLIPAGSTTLELRVPSEDDLDFTVANARSWSDRVQGRFRVVEASLPSVGNLSVRWQREIPEISETETEAAQAEARIYSEVYTLVGLADGIVSAVATVENTILFAGVDTFRIKLPEGMTLLDVKGAGLRDWSVNQRGVVTASLNYKAENSYSLTLEMEQVIGQDDVTVSTPLLEPLDVERSKGWVGVSAHGTLEVAGGDVSGATNVDVRTLPASILGITSQPVLLGYKYLGQDTSIPLTVSTHEEVDVLVTLLDQAEATTMFTADGRRLTAVRYEVRNNRRQFLRVSLPDGADLWSAAVAGRAVQPAKSGEEVLIPLVRSSARGGSLASFAVEVVYVENGEGPDASGRGTFQATLPGVDVPTTYVGWTVYAPFDARVKSRSLEGSLRPVEYLTRPLGGMDALVVSHDNAVQQQAAQRQEASGGLGDGAAPVRVRLPLDGEPYYFEKLLALEEDLTVSFSYSGLKD